MSQSESIIWTPLKFVAEPNQLWKIPDELNDGPERPRADLGLVGGHAPEVHEADGGGRAGPVSSG